MKKLYYAFAALAVLCLASCNKEETVATPEKSVVAAPVKVNISVGNLAPETKAMKKAWASGDLINIWFDARNNLTPDLRLTYDGTQWVAGEISSEAAASLSASGTVYGFWEDTNSALSWKNPTVTSDGMIIYNYYDDDSNDETYNYVFGAEFGGSGDYKVSYTFDGSKLEASIDTWKFINEHYVQFVITGIDTSKEWYLREFAFMNVYGIQIKSTSLDASLSGKNYYIRGRSNEDGVAFVGVTSVAEREYLFTLYNATDNKYYTYSLTAQCTNGGTKLPVGVKIAFSKFSEVSSATMNLRTNTSVSSSEALVTWSCDPLTMALAKGEGADANTRVGKSNYTLFNANNVLTFTPASGKTIKTIYIKTGSASYSSLIATSSWTNATATYTDSYVKITPTDKTSPFSCVIRADSRINSVNVLYSE